MVTRYSKYRSYDEKLKQEIADYILSNSKESFLDFKEFDQYNSIMKQHRINLRKNRALKKAKN